MNGFLRAIAVQVTIVFNMKENLLNAWFSFESVLVKVIWGSYSIIMPNVRNYLHFLPQFYITIKINFWIRVHSWEINPTRMYLTVHKSHLKFCRCKKGSRLCNFFGLGPFFQNGSTVVFEQKLARKNKRQVHCALRIDKRIALRCFCPSAYYIYFHAHWASFEVS